MQRRFVSKGGRPLGSQTRGSRTRGSNLNIQNLVNSDLEVGQCECFEIRVCKKECDNNGPDPSLGCTFTQGYWKTHGPPGCVNGNNTNQWPVASLMLGNVNYTNIQLCSILQQAVAGNGLISMSHQLIAAKLNVANGADNSVVGATIAAADALIGNLIVPPVGGGFLSTATTSAFNDILAAFNEGKLNVPHCP